MTNIVPPHIEAQSFIETPVDEQLYERLKKITPTLHQKLLLLLIATDRPRAAYERITKGAKIISAAKLFQKLGIIRIRDKAAYITSLGKRLMEDYQLLDNGKLTTSAAKLLKDFEDGKIDEL